MLANVGLNKLLNTLVSQNSAATDLKNRQMNDEIWTLFSTLCFSVYVTVTVTETIGNR